jgi:type VI secretion system Hcp family effector
VSWNVRGPAGPSGPEGPPGPPGATDVNINVTDDRAVARGLEGFIRFDGIEGESTEEGFEGWSRIISVDKAIDVPFDLGNGQPTGAVLFDSVEVIKAFDTASLAVGDALVIGATFDEVEIALVEETPEGQLDYLVYELESVQIESINWSGSSQDNGARPTESIALHFDRVTITYDPRDAEPVVRDWTPPGR